MRVVVQRVSKASVTVDDAIVGKIKQGMLVLFAVHKEDTAEKIEWLVQKLATLRIFSDAHGKMNLSLKDIGGSALIVSQFTLYGNSKEGRRPDFLESAPATQAIPIYEKFIEAMRREIHHVETGIFGAKMQVDLTNDGPVTLILDN